MAHMDLREDCSSISLVYGVVCVAEALVWLKQMLFVSDWDTHGAEESVLSAGMFIILHFVWRNVLIRIIYTCIACTCMHIEKDEIYNLLVKLCCSKIFPKFHGPVIRVGNLKSTICIILFT